MGIYKTFIFLILLFPLLGEARPISYSGGQTLMTFTNDMQDSLYFHYSPTYKYSLGIEKVDNKFFDKGYSYLRFTYLLNRKNTESSQRNLYFQSGLSSEGVSNNFFGIHGDWETRKLFAGFGYKEVNNKIRDYTSQYLQLGVAPYVGDYGDLHTWVMLKTKKNTLTKNWSTYPVLKLFKGNFLIELGYNNKTEWDTHLMYRF